MTWFISAKWPLQKKSLKMLEFAWLSAYTSKQNLWFSLHSTVKPVSIALSSHRVTFHLISLFYILLVQSKPFYCICHTEIISSRFLNLKNFSKSKTVQSPWNRQSEKVSLLSFLFLRTSLETKWNKNLLMTASFCQDLLIKMGKSNDWLEGTGWCTWSIHDSNDIYWIFPLVSLRAAAACLSLKSLLLIGKKFSVDA